MRAGVGLSAVCLVVLFAFGEVGRVLREGRDKVDLALARSDHGAVRAWGEPFALRRVRLPRPLASHAREPRASNETQGLAQGQRAASPEPAEAASPAEQLAGPDAQQQEATAAGTPLPTALPRIVVTMTSIPTRLPYVVDLLKSLSWQKLQADAVYLCVPKRSERLRLDYDIPPYLATHPNLTIVWSDKDYGPATKLIPVLDVETDPDTLIITVDDDSYVSDGMVRAFASAARLYPNAALGFGGWNMTCMLEAQCPGYPKMDRLNGNYIFVRQNGSYACTELRRKHGRQHCADPVVSLSDPRPVDVVEGYLGAAYRRRFFDAERLRDLPTNPRALFYVDDVWISGNLAQARVPRLIVPSANLHEQDLVPLDAKPWRAWGTPTDPRGRYDEHKWVDPGSIDSLHNGGAHARQSNVLGVRYFRQLGAW